MHAPTSWKYVARKGIVKPHWSKLFQNFWLQSFVFALEKQAKKPSFKTFFTLKDLFVGTFRETRAPTSRKYVAEQGIVMPNWSKSFKTFWLHFSNFALEKTTEKNNFQSFLPLRGHLVATSNETRASTFWKYVARRGIVKQNWSKWLKTFWPHPSIYVLEKQLQKLNFQNFVTSKRPLGG